MESALHDLRVKLVAEGYELLGGLDESSEV
jgi:hypothetical protein